MMESVPPDPRSPGAAVGVTEPMIHALVHGFYDAIRTDPMLGPIFCPSSEHSAQLAA